MAVVNSCLEEKVSPTDGKETIVVGSVSQSQRVHWVMLTGQPVAIFLPETVFLWMCT
jgi:hypothetical protein